MGQPPDDPPARGAVRLLNTAGGRVLCLAGAVDDAAVDSFVRRYGREPARIDRIDAGSVTSLSPGAIALLHQHLESARWAARTVAVTAPPLVERLLAAAPPSDGA